MLVIFVNDEGLTQWSFAQQCAEAAHIYIQLNDSATVYYTHSHYNIFIENDYYFSFCEWHNQKKKKTNEQKCKGNENRQIMQFVCCM